MAVLAQVGILLALAALGSWWAERTAYHDTASVLEGGHLSFRSLANFGATRIHAAAAAWLNTTALRLEGAGVARGGLPDADAWARVSLFRGEIQVCHQTLRRGGDLTWDGMTLRLLDVDCAPRLDVSDARGQGIWAGSPPLRLLASLDAWDQFRVPDSDILLRMRLRPGSPRDPSGSHGAARPALEVQVYDSYGQGRMHVQRVLRPGESAVADTSRVRYQGLCHWARLELSMRPWGRSARAGWLVFGAAALARVLAFVAGRRRAGG